MGLLKDSNDHFLPKEQGSFSKTKISWAISNTIPNITFFHFLSRYLCSFTLSSPLPSRNHHHPRKKGQRTHEKPYLSCIKPAKVLFFFVFLQLPPATRPTESLLGRGTTKEDDLGEKEGPLVGAYNQIQTPRTKRHEIDKEKEIRECRGIQQTLNRLFCFFLVSVGHCSWTREEGKKMVASKR